MKLQNKIRKILIQMLNVIALTTVLVVAVTACTTMNSKPGLGLDLNKEYEIINVEQNYKNLATLDLDQMNDLLQEKIREYEKNGTTQSLREALYIVFARPDEDGIVDKLISNVRNPLEEEVQWQNTIETLVRQSVDRMKNNKTKQADQVTAGIILENIISEFKPAYIKQYENGGFESDIITFIADSNVVYSKIASRERGLYLMRNNLSPSQIAKKLESVRSEFLKQKSK